jgi:hypothetical protein
MKKSLIRAKLWAMLHIMAIIHRHTHHLADRCTARFNKDMAGSNDPEVRNWAVKHYEERMQIIDGLHTTTIKAAVRIADARERLLAK